MPQHRIHHKQLKNLSDAAISQAMWLHKLKAEQAYQGEVVGVGRVKMTPIPILFEEMTDRQSEYMHHRYWYNVYRVEVELRKTPIDKLTESMVRKAIARRSSKTDIEVVVGVGKRISITNRGIIDVKIDRQTWMITVTLSEPRGGAYSTSANSLQYTSGGPYTFSFASLHDGMLGDDAAASIQRSLNPDSPPPSYAPTEGYSPSDQIIAFGVWTISSPAVETLIKKLGSPRALKIAAKAIAPGLSLWAMSDTDKAWKRGELTNTQMYIEQTSNVIGAIPAIGTAWTIGWETGRVITYTEWYQEFKYWVHNHQ